MFRIYGWRILQQDKPDNYVLATGKQYSIRDFVEKAFERININIVWEGAGVDEVGKDSNTGTIYVRINPKYFRPNEVGNLLGNPSKAAKELGWVHKYDIDRIVDEMVKNDLLLEEKLQTS